ncbi:MAG: hypothetical protein OXS40_04905 [Gammaproteobacteria bacterium]|nr:hypothetical protein [Gammaproteobacteria bacterium]
MPAITDMLNGLFGSSIPVALPISHLALEHEHLSFDVQGRRMVILFPSAY